MEDEQDHSECNCCSSWVSEKSGEAMPEEILSGHRLYNSTASEPTPQEVTSNW